MGFPEIRAEHLRREILTPTCSGRFVRDEDIMVLESRALLKGLHVSVSMHKNEHCRLLMLVDNMSVCVSASLVGASAISWCSCRFVNYVPSLLL